MQRNVITDHYRHPASHSSHQCRPPTTRRFGCRPLRRRPSKRTPRTRDLSGLASRPPGRAVPVRSDCRRPARHTHAVVAAGGGIRIPGAKSRVQRGQRLLRRLLTDCCAVPTSVSGTVIDYQFRRGCAVDSSDQRTRCSGQQSRTGAVGADQSPRSRAKTRMLFAGMVRPADASKP
jgi:hypothetical protein